jgi:hypothetical protein
VDDDLLIPEEDVAVGFEAFRRCATYARTHSHAHILSLSPPFARASVS